MESVTRVPKGLATLAMLKARFDDRQDHLALFEPFVEAAVGRISAGDFAAEDAREGVKQLFGLQIPSDTIATLLSRLATSGRLKRDAGRYLKQPGAQFEQLPNDQIQECTNDLGALGIAFVKYAKDHANITLSPDQGLEAIIGFVEKFNVPMLMHDVADTSITMDPHHSQRIERVVAGFVSAHCTPGTENGRHLETILQGFILQNVLLLRDVQNAQQPFRELLVLLDAPIAFAAMGLNGPLAERATKEALQLLRDAGAVPQVLDKTVAEMRRVLAVYEALLGTATGRMQLYQTELTRYFFTMRSTPSDVRQIATTLESALAGLGVGIRPAPTRDRRYTLDEIALSSALSRDGRPSQEPRVLHDIDGIAAALTLRAGVTASAIERCRAVFVSTSGLMIKNGQQWYRGQEGQGVPPLLHQGALTNIAWLKKPAKAATAKLHELIATCSVVLRPSRRLWEAFLNHLKNLRERGEISTDESVAIVANGLVEPLLSEIEVTSEPDASSLDDVIARVRANYRESVDDQLRETERRAEQASSRASVAERRSGQLESHSTQLAERIGRVVGRCVFWVGSAICLGAIVILLPGVFDHIGHGLQLIAWGAIVFASLVGLLGLLRGGHLGSIESWIAVWVSKHIREALSPRGSADETQ